jgi:hypothetical protein
MLCPVCGLDNDPSTVLCARCNSSLALGNPPPAEYPAPHPSMHLSERQPTMPQMPAPSSPHPAPVPWRLVIVATILVVLVGVASSVLIIMLTGKAGTTPVADRGTIALPTAVNPAASSSDPGAGPATPVAPGSAKERAAVIDKLLDRSVASRTKLNRAIAKVQRCTELPGALADMRRVGVERTQEIAEADAADVSGLANGEKVRSTLKSALGFALAADQHFVAWAQPTVAGGCADTAARQAAWAGGQASSQQAQEAKKQLVEAWNPVAAQFGFKQRTTQFI